MTSITHNDNTYQGRTAESIARRVWGRNAVLFPCPSDSGKSMIVKMTDNGMTSEVVADEITISV